ncbi:Clan SC, family S33, methylesterase-like serine peptidase [Trichomonas vaginalis G3]|uniref:Clan SC, family S33, methylesterase-like serine peptidase n=1 Tax=Trichomonas vaginalis (strain ATCC PRA-98 / G3) TaxID=412133 RepID=A2FIE6_TRIV3|nr:acylglycerol lipase protein [Trichomonas vaginalis G3]EAX95308.1 Clan SC, family S33, methylesterase-like serine peptidase [Trichomonas vaginalis G3]KAI5500575.1 acylglycerol lipase protein [Trichomonas vaginalis G3]|eukprot:XP_001308238.1 Clan SC, family S33, methylesterase-like serine peptidase [Trichomonas vaginalis G3]
MDLEKKDYTFDYDGENFTIITEGGIELVGCQWLPKNQIVRYVIIFFHGLGAFLSMNRTFFPKILADGGAVFGTDHLGHGRSPGDRGNNTTEHLHAELGMLLQRAKAVFPNIPVFLYGHSLGGVTSISYILTHPNESNWLDGVIIEALWIATHESLSNSFIHKILARFGRYIFPTLAISTGSDPDSYPYPKKFVEKFLASNLPHDYITPQLFASAYEMQTICKTEYKKWPIGLPLMFMQGGRDSSVGTQTNYEWIDHIRDQVGANVHVVYHEKAEHCMLRNIEGSVVLDQVIAFVNLTLARNPFDSVL